LNKVIIITEKMAMVIMSDDMINFLFSGSRKFIENLLQECMCGFL